MIAQTSAGENPEDLETRDVESECESYEENYVDKPTSSGRPLKTFFKKPFKNNDEKSNARKEDTSYMKKRTAGKRRAKDYDPMGWFKTDQ